MPMQPFKRPLIITTIAIGLAVTVGLVGVTWIFQSRGSNRVKQERAQILGAGVGTLT